MEKDHNNFDGIVRGKLENLHPALKAGSWEQLSARMDKAEQAEAFDKQAGIHLEGIRVPYQPNSWQILAERLALERGRFQAVLHYKIMEISMLVLLLVTTWQYLPIKPADVQETQISYPIASLETKGNTDLNSTTVILSNSELTNSNTLTFSNQTNKFTHSRDRHSVKTNTNAKQKTTRNRIVKIEQNREDNPNATPLNRLPLANLLNINIENTPQAQLREYQGEKATGLVSPTDDFRQNGAIAALDGQGFSLLDYGNPDELLEYIRPIEQKTFIRIGFMGSPDYNRVITPTQKLEDGTEISLDRHSLSYSGGISIGVEHGRWEIETGVIYALRKYQAIPTLYVSGNIKDGYRTTGLKDFELNTVDIPLKFRYNFFVHDKWRIYALAGASINVVLNANYYTVDQSAFASLSAAPPNTETSSAQRPQALKNKQLTEGWLEGGTFLENATLYANFGMGVERYMSYRLSLFVQPTYQYGFLFFNNGLGPYGDKIHNFGINTGLKVRL